MTYDPAAIACRPIVLPPPLAWRVRDSRRWGAIALKRAMMLPEARPAMMRHARAQFTDAARAVLQARGLGPRIGR